MAGLAVARQLCLAHARDVRVTVVSPSPAGRLSPFVPGILSGWIDPLHALLPFPEVLSGAEIRIGRVVAVDPHAKSLCLDGPGVRSGTEPSHISFDALVIATGALPAVSQVPGGLDHALPSRSPRDMMRIRNQLALAFETASVDDSARRRRALLSVAVMGRNLLACHTALELSTLLIEATRQFGRVQAGEPQVSLVTGGEALLSDLDPRMANVVRGQLALQRVEVCDKRLASIDADHVCLNDGEAASERREARTVVWADGDEIHPCWQQLSEGPSLSVDGTGQVQGAPGVFVVGDASPRTRRAASDPLEQAAAVAANVVAVVRGAAATCAVDVPSRSLLLGPHAGAARVGSAMVVPGVLGGWMARRRFGSLAPRRWRRALLAGRNPDTAMLVHLDPEPPRLHLTAPPPAVRSTPPPPAK